MRVYPFDKVQIGSTEVARNLFTNPRLVGDGTWAEVRRNLASDPLATWNGNINGQLRWGAQWYGTGGAGNSSLVGGASDGPLPGVSTYFRKTWTVVGTNVGDIAFAHAMTGVNGFPVTPGEVISASTYIRTSWSDVGSSTYTARISFRFFDSAGTEIPASNGPAVARSAGNEWRRFSHTATVPANAAFLRPETTYYVDVDRLTVGATLDGTALLVERSSVVGDFFAPGLPSIDPDMRQRWLGAENASESVMEIERVAVLTATNCIAGVSARAGKPAVRLIPINANNASYTTVALLASGVTRTFMATAHFDAAISPLTNSANLARLRVFGTSTVPAPPNTPGTYPQVDVVTTTAVREAVLYHGSTVGSGDVWWTDIGLFAGSYDGPAFTGGDPDDGDIFFDWVGAVDNSASQMWRRDYLPVADGTVPHTVIEVDDLDPDVAEITVWRDDGTRWSEVRGALRVPVAGAWSGVDWECGFNRATSYRVEQFDSGGLSLGFLPATSVTLSVESSWVHNVLAPKAGVPVMLTDAALRSVDRPYDAEVVFARGASYGTAVGSTRRGLVGVNLTMVTDTLDQADRVQALLGSPGNELPPVLCFRKGSNESVARIPHTVFVHTPSISEVEFNVRLGGEVVTHEMVATEVRPPARHLSTPLLTLTDLDAFYATLGDIDADNLTLGDIDRRWDLAGYATV